MKKVIGVLLILACASTAVAAEGHLNVRTVVQKETVRLDDGGAVQTELVSADTVVPGENVFYTITFQNISEEPADNVVITNPIAESLTYLDGSAFGPGTEIRFSVDGGHTFAGLDELTVIEDGEERAATADDVTHIRWRMQEALAAGAQGVARFAAVLN